MNKVLDRINLIHQRPLHEGQIELARAYFVEKKKVILSQWGRSAGKALDVNTPILTTEGWKTMLSLEEGDFVFGDDGKPTCVTFKSEIFYNHKCYRITFSDNTSIIADAGHRWKVMTKQHRKALKKRKHHFYRKQFHPIYTTEELKSIYRRGVRNEAHLQIAQPSPVQFPKRNLPIDPYTLGVWLGDGSSRWNGVTSADPEIFNEVVKAGYRVTHSRKDELLYTVHGLSPQLRAAGLLKNKHIPQEYLLADEHSRLKLLQGLMDTDGYAAKLGHTIFYNTNKKLAEDVAYLARSLGMKAHITSQIKKCQTGASCECWNVNIVANRPIFALSRKLARMRFNRRGTNSRIIQNIEEVESRPTICIAVDNESHLFLAGEQLIPTHNTEAVLYIAWVKALLDPGSEIYIICPERDQGEKIYWKSRRLQEYGPTEYIAQERASDLTLVFNNSSYIVIEGAKNAKSLRGIKPTLVFYDELQDHGEEFDKEVMRPNLLGRGCSLIATGTPPKMECYYTQFKKRVMEAIRDGDQTRAYFQFPNTINSGLNKEEIDKEIAALIAQGDEAIVKREYYGEDCYGGKDAVFPLWDRQKHVKRHGLLLLTCFTARAHTKWLVVCDPANHSCFAVLFCVHNPITSEFFVLDEIYQTDRKKTDATSMWGQIQDKVKELNPDQKWHYIYDEREAWFAREISANFHVQMTPTKKQKKGSGEEAGINAMKMLMRAESAFHVSDKCYWFTWEIQNYVTDEHGQLVDRHNHLLDCCRYALNYCGFSFVEKTERTGQKALRLGGEVIAVKNSLKTAEDWSEEMVEASLGAGSWERDYF